MALFGHIEVLACLFLGVSDHWLCFLRVELVNFILLDFLEVMRPLEFKVIDRTLEALTFEVTRLDGWIHWKLLNWIDWAISVHLITGCFQVLYFGVPKGHITSGWWWDSNLFFIVFLTIVFFWWHDTCEYGCHTFWLVLVQLWSAQRIGDVRLRDGDLRLGRFQVAIKRPHFRVAEQKRNVVFSYNWLDQFHVATALFRLHLGIGLGKTLFEFRLILDFESITSQSFCLVLLLSRCFPFLKCCILLFLSWLKHLCFQLLGSLQITCKIALTIFEDWA